MTNKSEKQESYSRYPIHNETLNLSWKLINLINEISRSDASWQAVERREGQSLKELKAIATVRSVGASTRIEGSKMSDEEVDVLLRNLNIANLDERDQQEVAGYIEVLDIIDENFEDLPVSENGLKNLHNQLLKYSKKDEWHKGNYKQHANAVEANLLDGSSQIIFKTTAPGFATEDAIGAMISWYNTDKDTNELVRCALFCHEFVTIHPFQDGNGRLSRLLATLLLRKTGYQWIRYISFEHEIESQKTEYYRVLRACQAQRPGENVTEWVTFFLLCLRNIQEALTLKLDTHENERKISLKEKKLLYVIESTPGIKTGEISKKLDVSNSTVKRMLDKLIMVKKIERQGIGPGSYYILL